MKTFFISLFLLFCSLGSAQETDTTIEVTTLDASFNKASTLNGKAKYEESQKILKDILHKLPIEKKKARNPDAYDKLEVMTLYELAYGLFSLNQLEKANAFCEQTIQKSESTKDISMLIESYNLSGLIHKRRFMLDKGIEEYQKALALSINQGNHTLSKIIMSNIASLYTELERNKEALEMGRKMTQYFPTEKTDTEQSQIQRLLMLNTVGVLLDNTALSENAVDTFRIAINEIKQTTPAGLKLLLYTNYAKSLNSTGKIDSAQYYFEHAVTLIPETNNPYNISNLHYLYGHFLKNVLQNPQQASLHLRKAAELCRKSPTIILTKSLEEWADLEAIAFNNPAKAYTLLLEAYQTYRENTKKQYQNKLSGFEAEFKTREKEAKISELNRLREVEQTKFQIQIISTLSILLIAILIVIILIYSLRKRKAEFNLKELSLQHAINRKEHEIETLTMGMTQKMTEKYINGLEDSNKRVAGELHDGICNKLLALNMSLEHTTPTQLAQELASLYSELRVLSHELASPEFKTITLNQTLDVYMERLKQANLFELTYFADAKIEAINFDQTVAREVYRIIQEALSNIIKHAAAQSVHITISENQGNVEIMIEDDGKGYDTGIASEGIGVKMMKERAASLNAKLAIESTPNRGTVIYVSIPYC